MIEEHDGLRATTVENDAEIITRSVRSNWQESFLDSRLRIEILQVTLEIVPGTMQRPGSKLLRVCDAHIAKPQITDRKEAHDDVFFLAVAGVQKERIGLGMATVVLQEKLPIICWELVANMLLEGRDLSVGRRTSRQRMSDVSHEDLGRP
jgi:hypothetical protein